MTSQDRQLRRTEDIRDLLEHYFAVAFKSAGLKWTADNAAEIRQLAELITDLKR